MKMRDFLRGATTALTFAACLFGSTAHAHWLRAESTHFVVYGEGGEVGLRRAVQNLEEFDTLLRQLTGLNPPDDLQKPSIYLVNTHAELAVLSPGLSPLIAGYYFPSVEYVGAFALQGESSLGAQEILFHEYTHHFMFESSGATYPPWYVEGFAEYVQTATFVQGRVTIGAPSRARTEDALDGDWPPVETFLSMHHGHLSDRQELSFYAESWVATHYLFESSERTQQLRTYLRGLAHGADPIQSFQPAFGMSPDDFVRTLRTYIHRRIDVLSTNEPAVDVSNVRITQLSPGADALLLLDARLRRGQIADADRAPLADQVEQIAAQFPTDAFAQHTHARALLLRGDYAGGRTLLQGMIAANASDEEAYRLLGQSYLREAEAASTNQSTLARQARPFFVHAFSLKPDDVPTLYGYACTFPPGSAEFTNDVVNVLLRAHELAPQVDEISVNTASVLMLRGRYDEAVAILRPIAFSPHPSSFAHAAQSLLSEAEQHAAANVHDTPGEPDTPTTPQDSSPQPH
ncbi:MAG: hypothetical protein ABUL73_01785 [Alphaproteobacteria bacterium]